jgi:mRNA interferase RelE/StbE
MEIEFFNEAEKDIKKLFKGNKRIAQKSINILKEIADGKENKNIKKLVSDSKERFRLKIENYRIIYKIENDILLVYVIKSRQEVYKWLRNN